MVKNILKIENVTKSFNGILAVNNVSITIYAGEFFSILGPSGCGKTTLLRIIAGFEIPDSGFIYLEDAIINSEPPYKRNLNTVFQNYALFPHLNIYENVAFGLKIKGLKKEIIDEKVYNSLKLVGLTGQDLKKPHQLSGGQQQRVALARAIVNEPPILLLDEPLGALDLKLRHQMQRELKDLQRRLGITFIYVTHDQEEALTMSDRIAIMKAGKIEQIGKPIEIYEKPVSSFVANFLGTSNIFTGNLTNGNGIIYTLVTENGVKIKTIGDKNVKTGLCKVMIRPEKIQIYPTEPKNFPLERVNLLKGEIEHIIYLGTILQFIINLNGDKLTVFEKNSSYINNFYENQEVFVSWDIENTLILSEKSIYN